MVAPEKQTDLFQYILIIKKEKPLNIDLISILLCFISFAFFIYHSFLQNNFVSVVFLGALLIPVTVTRSVWLKKKSGKSSITFKHPLLITGIIWLFIPGLRWFFILFVLFVLFDHQARHPLEIGVSDEQIVINTFFRKRYRWSDFSNVILKDNLLTLDFKNNKVLQREIEPYLSNVNEKEFNAFCAEQIQKG
ncbi:MAG: hypothetical protein J0I84_19075 [Terrimonas sp.]|nr:hypothetical protein [Terrimonas sp.]OJY98097.1 MAG: hypothetical protein BGP13_10620 [Sphingobacteriales bacterium 40-81]